MVRHVPPGKADARRTRRATASPQPSFRMTGCHVIIIGAGIGGLAAALSLHRHGMRVSVYEQAPELREFGAGLMVTPNAMHALDFLGVGDVIAARSNVSAGLLIKHYRTGEVLEHRSHGDAYRLKYGAGNFQVHRADLHNALSAAVLANDAGCIHLAHAFTDLSQDDSGVVARFTNGVVASADALIGCDGGRSRPSATRSMIPRQLPIPGKCHFARLYRRRSCRPKCGRRRVASTLGRAVCFCITFCAKTP